MIDFTEFEQDTKSIAPGDEQLRLIASLAVQHVAANKALLAAQKSVEVAQKEFDRIAKKELPEAMSAAGVQEFVLSDGTKVSTSTEYHAGISEKNSDEAFAWLRDNGHGALIKSQVGLTFGKGEATRVSELSELLSENGFEFSKKDSVHPSTLKAFVREQLESGVSIPEKAFGIFKEKVSKVKEKK